MACLVDRPGEAGAQDQRVQADLQVGDEQLAEYARRDDEIRLAFDEPIRTVADAPAHMFRLLTGAPGCLHRTT